MGSKNPWSASELCAIIEACGKAGVRIFRAEGVALQLGPPKEIPLQPQMDPEVLGSAQHARQNTDALRRDESDLRADQLALLAIEDPVEYERQLRDEELGDEPGESDL